jgi:hypothetical protein
MCLGDDFFQALLQSFWRPFVRKCGRSQGEHCGNWLAQIMGSLLDGAWPLSRSGQISPVRRRRVDCLPHGSARHVPHPE